MQLVNLKVMLVHHELLQAPLRALQIQLSFFAVERVVPKVQGWQYSVSCDHLKFLEIADIISETVQNRYFMHCSMY